MIQNKILVKYFYETNDIQALDEGLMVELKSVGSVLCLLTGNIWPMGRCPLNINTPERRLELMRENYLCCTDFSECTHEFITSASERDRLMVYAFIAGCTNEDLFNHLLWLPKDVQAKLDDYAHLISEADKDTYKILENMEKELKLFGLEFDWGLDAEPHNLRTIR